MILHLITRNVYSNSGYYTRLPASITHHLFPPLQATTEEISKRHINPVVFPGFLLLVSCAKFTANVLYEQAS